MLSAAAVFIWRKRKIRQMAAWNFRVWSRRVAFLVWVALLDFYVYLYSVCKRFFSVPYFILLSVNIAMMILKKNVLYLPTYLCPNVFRHVSPDIAVAQNRIHIKEEEKKSPHTPGPSIDPSQQFSFDGKKYNFFSRQMATWNSRVPQGRINWLVSLLTTITKQRRRISRKILFWK